VYLEKTSTAAQLRKLAKSHYSPKACIYHYLHMAQGNFRQYLKGEQVKTKKYFYMLRPILAIRWIEQGYEVAPTGFGSLLESVVPARRLKEEILRLIELNRQGAELEAGPRIPVISDFIEGELSCLEGNQADYRSNAATYEVLDDIFRNALREVWLS
jgi:uncharacterized protein